jgi:hypothetical protein
MYWTGLNPLTGKRIDVVYDYSTKKKLKRIMLDLPVKNKKQVDATPW